MTSIEALIDRQLTRRQLFEKARGAQPQAQSGSPGRLQVITVSREIGSGGRQLAERLASRLSFEFIDRQILDRLVEDSGARQRLIASLDEKARSGIDLWVEGVLTGRYIDRSEYNRLLAHSITTLAEHGHAVILGRAANVILGPRGGLHVRVVAPREIRVQNLMKSLGLTALQAEEKIRRSDDERRRFYADVFRADADSATDYHLVVNTGLSPLDVAEELVLTAWKHYLRA